MATVAVRMLVPAPGAAIDVDDNLIVTPLGAPVTLKLTGALKALLLVIVIFVVPLELTAASIEDDESVMTSAGALTTVRLNAAECEVLPLVPTTFTAYTPAVTLVAATNVKVVLPDAESVAGENVDVTPAGKPVTEN